MITWLYDFNLSPEENVQKDYLLFDAIGKFATPIVARVHTFGDYCATTGFLTRLSEETQKRFEGAAVPLLRRVTGGAVALHGEDLCISFLFRGSPEMNLMYRYCVMEIRRIVAEILNRVGGIPADLESISPPNRRESEYCLRSIDEADISLNGEKIAGFAGRVRKNRFLIHLQVVASGWNPDMLMKLLGIYPDVSEEIIALKMFVYSRGFLDNMKEKVECVFSSQFGKNSRVSQFLNV